MFCGKCGSNIPDGAKFCPSCGNNVEIPVTPAPAAPVTPAPAAPVTPAPAAPVTPAPAAPAPTAQNNNAGAFQQPVNTYPTYAPVQNGKKAKNGKKTALIVIGVIVALLAAAALVIAFCWQSIVRGILGEAGYYALREAKTLQKIFSVEDMENLGDNKVVNADAKVNVKAEDGVYDKAFEAVSADVNMSFNTDEQKAVATVGLVSENETKAEAFISYEKGKIGITVPKLTDEKFYSDLGVGEQKIDLDYETIGEELLAIYKRIEGKHIKTNTTVEKKVVNGQKCRCVTLNIDGDESAEFIIDLLTQIKNDDALINALDPALEAAYNGSKKMTYDSYYYDEEDEKTYEEFKKEFIDNFDEIIESVREEIGNEQLTLKLSYASDSKGNIVNRTVELTEDGKKMIELVADSNVKSSYKTFNFKLVSVENLTEISLVRSDNRSGACFEIEGKSVEYFDEEEDDGTCFTASLSGIRVGKINNVNVLLGDIDVTVTPIYDGEKETDGDVRVSVNFADNGVYALNAKLEIKDYEDVYKYEINVESTLSSGTDFNNFQAPDSKAITDFEEFLESMSNGFEEVATDVLEDVDPDLLLQISKDAQIKDCEAREELIEKNLNKYLNTGDSGKPFTNVSDVLTMQSAFDDMFDEGHPPYCTCGGNTSGSKYDIYVYSDLSYSITCRNPNCPNYGN